MILVKEVVGNWSAAKTNQIFRYTRCITLKCVTSLRGHLRIIAPAGNTAPFEEMLQRWRAVGNTVSDLTVNIRIIVGNTVSDLTARDSNLRPPAPKTNTSPLDQLAGIAENSLLKLSQTHTSNFYSNRVKWLFWLPVWCLYYPLFTNTWRLNPVIL